MSIADRDFILRLIRQLAAALAIIVGKRSAGDLDGARRELERTRDTIFGPIASSLPMLDATAIASLLGEEKARVYARLMSVEADLCDDRGDAAAARTCRRRARAVLSALPPAGAEWDDAQLGGLADESPAVRR